MDDKEWKEKVSRVCEAVKAKFLVKHSDVINGLDETERELFEETWHKGVHRVVTAKGMERRYYELNLESVAYRMCYGAIDCVRRRRWLEDEKAKAVQEKVLELAAKQAALEVAKKPDDVVRAIKVVERKVDNVSRNVKKDGRITREIKKQLDGDLAATDHDNEGEFKPNFKRRDDEDLLKDAWEAVHSDDKKGSRQCICLNIYRKDHPEAKVKDKAFRSFYNAIMYQLRRETQHSQS